MMILAGIGLLIILFIWLGKVADVVVSSAKRISQLLGVNLFFFGVILGLFTSVPEFSIAVNSFVDNVSDVSLGNLMGGVMVVFGLVFGLSVVLNRRIATDGNVYHILPVLGYALLPFAFAFDGTISQFDSLLLVAWYLWILLFLYHHFGQSKKAAEIGENRSSARALPKELFFLVAGIIVIFLISNLIVRVTETLLVDVKLSGFFVGLILFSLGTNLPEVTVMFRAWKNHVRELTVSHLVGSVIANPLIIGLFGFLRPFEVARDILFIDFLLFNLLLFFAFAAFYRSDKAFRRSEGVVLIAVYSVFFVSQIFLAIMSRV